jgi:hypothetical protein
VYDKLQNVYCSDNFDDGCSGYYIMVTFGMFVLYMDECNDGCILVALVMTMAMVAAVAIVVPL